MQARVKIIDAAACGPVEPPPLPPGKWTRQTKPRRERRWVISRQQDKVKRATCHVCHGPIQAGILRVQLEGQKATRSHYRHLNCLVDEWAHGDTL
eukprot:11032510-Prorocentrum_lima.AAC.1